MARLNIDNHVLEFLPSGVLSYERRWELLEDARESIHIVTFSFMNDDTTKKLFEILTAKAKEGVRIKIIYDDIVNRTTFMINKLSALEKYGIEVFGYNSIWDGWKINRKKGHPFKQLVFNVKLKLKQHFHEKYMIIDNRHAILGGINWGDKYAYGGLKPKAWRDTDVYIAGDTVMDIQMQFLRDYRMLHKWKTEARRQYRNYVEFAENYRQEYENESLHVSAFPAFLSNKKPKRPPGEAGVHYMVHKPYDLARLDMTNFLLREIAHAKKRIYWGCHGIRPPAIFAEYFVAAVKRGVKVVLITNSKISSKTLMVNGLMGWMYQECTKHFHYLLENGIEIYEWQKPGAFHSKNLIIDHDFSTIGSYNIANGSAFHHSESNVVVRNREFCHLVYEQFTKDLESCVQLNLKYFKAPKNDAYKRILHERYKMIDKELLTPRIKSDLEKHKYKDFPLYEFIDIS